MNTIAPESRACTYQYDGRDTDGTVWYLCTAHDELAPSNEAPCAGYRELPYIEPAGREG